MFVHKKDIGKAKALTPGDEVSYRFEIGSKGACAKDVVIEVAAEAMEPAEHSRETGIVKGWREEKGYGFIGRDDRGAEYVLPSCVFPLQYNELIPPCQVSSVTQRIFKVFPPSLSAPWFHFAMRNLPKVAVRKKSVWKKTCLPQKKAHVRSALSHRGTLRKGLASSNGVARRSK